MSAKITKLKLIHQTNKMNTGTIFWFHGSGDSGEGFYNWIKFHMGDFTFPHLKCIFPTAPIRHYTPTKGAPVRVWFDRNAIDPDAEEEAESIGEINTEIKRLVDSELSHGTPFNKIIVGGFSMGGAIALQTAYRNTPGLAGVFTMCTYLNKNSSVFEALKDHPENALDTPVLMFHGSNDKIVDLEWGRATFKRLTELGVTGDFRVIPNTFHDIGKEQLIELFQWFNKLIPEPKKND